MSLETLTDSQRSALETYLDITGESDIENAIVNLKKYGFDLEKALTTHFDEPEQTSSNIEPSLQDSSTNLNDSFNSGPSSNTRSPNNRSTNNSSGFSLLSLFSWPFNLVLDLLLKVISFPMYLFSGYRTIGAGRPREAAHFPFNVQFNEAYGNIHPQFISMEYPQVVEKAKRELKYLLVVLQSDEHDDTDEFCRKTLCSPLLCDFIQSKNILVWGGNVRYTEGYQVSVTLQVNTYPFLALVALKPRGSENSSNIMAVLDRIEGLTEPEEVIARITRQMERLDPELIVLRSERAEQEAARMIREQQDMAYQNSLLADQEKAKRREKQREEEEREERRLKVEFENKALQARYHYLYHNKLLQQLSLEPNSSEPNVSRFSIRLLNGERAIRRFRASDTILDLYEYVETLLPLEEDAPTTPHSESIDELPDGYQHQFLFRLHSAFPRTCIEPTETVLSETNFWPGANLMVESIYLD